MFRKTYLYSALLAAALLAASLTGCSSGNKEDSSNPASVAKVGDTACYQCHAATSDPLTGETFIEQYQRSLHAELGCESCHGGGAQHNGVGPFPYTLNSATTDAEKAARCAQCHDGVTQVTTLNGEVVTAPLTSSTNFSNGNHANPFSEEEAHEAKCARCHSYEGSILYGQAGFTGDASIINNPAFQPVLGRDPETFGPIRCGTCHEHGGNIRQTKTRDAAGNIVTWDPNGNKVIDQLDVCTGCHTYTTNFTTKTGKLIGSGNVLSIANTAGGFTNVSTAAYYHNTRWFRTLPSTHYDQPASGTPAGGGNTLIEGYVLRNVGQTVAGGQVLKTPCYDCHGHEFKTNTRALADRPERGDTIFTEWGKSGHAGKILTQKVAAAATVPAGGAAQVDAVMKAGANEASGAAWSHYDWDHTLNANNVDDRGSCQMCHTSTGYSNYVTDPANYNFRNNDFTHLSGWKKATATAATVSSGQNEMLYCWGCHSNAGAGKLRITGSATLSFPIDGQSVVINNVGKSAVCVVCHGGRGSVGALTATDTRSSRFQGHHAPVAGVMFAAQTHIAFEYAGQNYINPAFQHDKINASTDGPCASCHMASKNHTFDSISSAGGKVQKIFAQSLCNTCHGSLPTTVLDDDKAGYAEATVVLNNFVNNITGFINYLNLAITSANINTKNAAGTDFLIPDEAYGAFQNGKLNGDEPCAYVHNPTYARRIVFDSIDWMDNGALNGTISFDATAFPKAAAWLG
ncbi:MAG TPA: C-type polyheme cytochrome OmcB, partial [Geobacteraceae bacterium]